MKNVISVDVEQWFHRRSLQRYIRNVDLTSAKTPSHVLRATQALLKLFDKYNKTTTFFVLGEVAELLPELVESIAERGHEVAFHGYSHVNLRELGQNKFQRELESGISMLRHITKRKVQGFRAPNFSLNDETVWALNFLSKYGFKYDSSIFPVMTPQYGSHTKIHTNVPSWLSLSEDCHSKRIVEFPMLVRKAGFLEIPAAGGFYLRLFGAKFILDSIRSMNRRGYPAMCYIHPWEVYGFPKVKLPVHIRLYAYYRVPCFQLFEKLVREIDIAPAVEVLRNISL